MSSPSKRRDTDVMKLLMAGHEVHLIDDSPHEFMVKFHGPKDTLYEGGVWKVHVELPLGYPFKSPSIGFGNRLFHPNVDEASGSVCLDVINQTWSPMYDLCNIFSTFLPQLLAYPNPSDPLNGEAAALQLREPERYKARVLECVRLYANDGDISISSPGVAASSSGAGSSEAAGAAAMPVAPSSVTSAVAVADTGTRAAGVAGSDGSRASTQGAEAGATSDALGGDLFGAVEGVDDDDGISDMSELSESDE